MRLFRFYSFQMNSLTVFLTSALMLSFLTTTRGQKLGQQSPNNGTLEEDEQSFEEYEKEFKNSIKTLVKSILPQKTPAARSPMPSMGCLMNLNKIRNAAYDLKEWALKLIDSSGKISGGLLEGSAMSLGSYDECQDIVIGGGLRKKSSKVGSYCMIEVKPSKVILDAIKEYQAIQTRVNSSIARSKTFLTVLKNVKSNPNEVAFRIGLCVTSGCSVKEVQMLVDIVAKAGNFPAVVKRCEVKKETSLELHHEIILGILGVFLLLVALSSLAELCLSLYRKDFNQNIQESNWRWRWVLVFSVFNNTKELMKCNLEGDALDPIRGIKVITVIMAIFIHSYALPHPLHIYRYSSAFNFLKFTEEFSFSMVANSSCGVETFFFIAGFLSIYLKWRQINVSSICGYIARFIFLNMFRMIFAQLLVICLFMLLPLLGSGPLFQEFVEEPLDKCKQYWWSNLLFIQNFWKPYDACLYQTWILAVMMQLMLFTAIVIYIMDRWSLLGIGAYSTITIVAAIIVGVVTHVSNFPATFAVYFYDYRTSLTMWKYLYVQAYNHAGPYCVGALSAYFCAVYPSVKINYPLLTFGWCSAIGTLLSVVYGLYDYRDGHVMHRALAIFYSAMHRPAWGAAVGWIIYACATGNGGVVNSILSWKAFVPMERLCYLIYLVHVPIMYFHGGIQREKLYMSHFNQMMSFVSYTCFSFIVSYACYVTFVSPYFYFEKLIVGRYQTECQVVPYDQTKKPKKEEENNSSQEIGSIDALFSKTSTAVNVVEADGL